jgi:hypothetical protein
MPSEAPNSLGVGLYCGGDASNACSSAATAATAPLCSSRGNTDGGKLNTLFCFNHCEACVTDCGDGASCECDPPAYTDCECAPNSCVAALFPPQGCYAH